MRRALLVLLVVGCTSTARAQVVNPTRATFTASADHTATVGAVAVLDHYQLDVMVGTPTGALAFTFGLGKPTPAADNSITIPVPPLATLASGLYVATVSAVGPGGTGRSVPSDPFARVASAAAPGKPTIQ